MKLAIAQIDTTVGDFKGNERKIIDNLRLAEKKGADLVVFPELTVCGYPPRDLLDKPVFVKENLLSVERIAKATKGTAVVLGYVSWNESKIGKGLFNMAGILYDGKVQFSQAKTLLPQYDVFDEKRHFEPAVKHLLHKFKGRKLALSLCEDLWSNYEFDGRRLYRDDPIELFAKEGAELIINLSASPYTLEKQKVRETLACKASKKFSIPIVYCNLVGGNDELIFDGRSIVTNKEGTIVCRGKAFEEDHIIVDIDDLPSKQLLSHASDEKDIIDALVLGLRDYTRKCSFKSAVVGLSGGIDSALVAFIASMAIGAGNVKGLIMPSEFTSEKSIDDAKELADRLQIKMERIDITEIYNSYRKTLNLKGKDVSLAEENIQARIRGNILMAYSNREGAIVLSTGNKSELSVGYCTLYGDLAGGLAVISDIPKTLVYRLAEYINKTKELIPKSILTKAPTAELKPNQTDQDSLPPYGVLDAILKAYVEEHEDLAAIVKRGFDKSIVEDILRRVNLNEYKRRQSPPGLKVTSKAFGIGRRFPIAWKG